MANEHSDKIRIVQETVAGKEITFAHVMGGPAPIIYQKLGLNPQVDYGSSAIGIMNMTPFYRNYDYYGRDFRCHVCDDRSCGVFP